MLVGLDCGQTEGADREGKSACYKVVQELLARSQADNGSLICAEILGLKGHEKAQSSYVASARTAEYYKTSLCCQSGECCTHFCRLSERKTEVVLTYIKKKPYKRKFYVKHSLCSHTISYLCIVKQKE